MNLHNHCTDNCELKITLFDTGYCTTFEKLILPSQKFQRVQCHALFALIQHPHHGPILFDTGYAPRVLEETHAFPYRFYRWITPMYCDEKDSAFRKLQDIGIEPDEIKTIVVSHFHADHIGGLKDFKNAQFIYLDAAYKAIQHLRGFQALRKGFLKGLLPPDFKERSLPIGKDTKTCPLPYKEFPYGYDLLGDQTLITIPLEGHAKGHMGFLIQREKPLFFIGDACWHQNGYMQSPHPLTRLIIDNFDMYRQTLKKLHTFHTHHPEVTLIPTHCPEMFQTMCTKDEI